MTTTASIPDLDTLGRTPIPGPDPGGAAVPDCEAYVALRAQMRLGAALDGPGPDWSVVIAHATDLLAHHGKDLGVACDLCLALCMRDGGEGLARGLRVLTDLLTTHWTTMHPGPDRAERRERRLSGLARALTRQARRTAAGPPAADADVRAAVDALLEAIALRSNELDATALDPWRALGNAIDERSAETAFESPAPTPAPTPRATTAAIPSPSDDDPEHRLRAARRGLVDVGSALLDGDALDPRAYRLARFALWFDLDPETNGAGTVLVPGLDTADATGQLADLRALPVPERLVAIERTFHRTPCWLDLQHELALAARDLGTDGAPVAGAVRHELGALLERRPDLPEMRFERGAELASTATRRWLSETVGGTPTTAPVAAPPPPSTDTDDADVMAEARRTAAGGDLAAAVGLVDAALATTRATCGRFRLLLDLADLLLHHGEPGFACAQLTGMERWIERHELETWDPDLVARYLELLTTASPRGADDARGPAPRLPAARVRDRLATLSPGRAWSLRIT